MAEGGRRERDPMPMGSLVRQLVSGRGWGEHLALGRLLESWAEVVGTRVAERSRPVSLAKGVLTVRAEGGAWASELSLLAPSLAAEAARFLGRPEAVRSVKVVAGSGGPERGSAGSSERG